MQQETYTIQVYIVWYLIVQQCGVVYLSVHLVAKLLTEISWELLGTRFQSFFFQKIHCIFKELGNSKKLSGYKSLLESVEAIQMNLKDQFVYVRMAWSAWFYLVTKIMGGMQSSNICY